MERDLLVVGGGIAGMALAIRMRAQGWSVDIVEADPDWKVYGAGITITGPSYRAFKRLGVLDELVAKGFASPDPTLLCAPDGTLITEQTQLPLEPGLPVVGGIMRPALHGILSAHTRASGTVVRLNVSVQHAAQADDRVDVQFTDGSAKRYALVVGADGAFSAMRKTFFPEAPAPRYTGQYCWRVVAPRPAEITQCRFYLAGNVTAGLVPTSPTQMYMFLLHTDRQKQRIEESMLAPQLRAHMAPFSGLLGQIRETLNERSGIIVRPLEALLMPRPWHRGRMILIGDAIHATTPHLASGAGIAVEDALVLSEELAAGGELDSALTRFEERRWERCRLVVENSVGIGDLQQAHAPPAAIGALMGRSEAALRQDV